MNTNGLMVHTQHPPGCMGIISGDLSRWPEFWRSFLGVKAPAGSRWRIAQGNGIADNRNRIVEALTDQDAWLWFIDDDHTFEPDVLMKLLARNVDIVTPLCMTRKPPYQPYAYEQVGDDVHGGFAEIPWERLPQRQLVEVAGATTGGMLIRRRVFEAMKPPWFEMGKLASDLMGEDLYFCAKARALGFKAYVDTDTWTGHMGSYSVWPMIHADGMWGAKLDVGNNTSIDLRPSTDDASKQELEARR